MIQNLIDRFRKHEKIIRNFQHLLPHNIVNESSIENIFQCVQFYPDFNVLPNVLKGEIEMWVHKWLSTAKEKRPSSAIECFTSCEDSIYPTIKELLKILSTLPVSTATPERSFSTLRRLKTYLRNTMSNYRISGLALMNIHREINLDTESVLKAMAMKRKYLVL